MESILIQYKSLGSGKIMAISEYMRNNEEISKKISVHYKEKRYEIGILEKSYVDASDAIIFNANYIVFYNSGIFNRRGMFINGVYDLKQMRFLSKNYLNEKEIFDYLSQALINQEACEEFLLPRKEVIQYQHDITKKLLYKHYKK